MKNFILKMIAMLIALSVATISGASTIFLDDWGVSPGSWTPTNAPSNTQWITEDFVGAGGYVGPGWGGQLFDAEAAYFGVDGTKLYFAIVTGLPPQGASGYDPGDLAIDFDSNGSYEFAVTTRRNNTNSRYAPTPGEGKLLSGNLQWFNTEISWGGISNPWAVRRYNTAVDLGTDYSYKKFGNGHYAIEAILDKSLLGTINSDFLTFHWTMECGNDNINLNAEIPPVPEPSTLLLLGAGLSGVALYMKRRKQS